MPLRCDVFLAWQQSKRSQGTTDCQKNTCFCIMGQAMVSSNQACNQSLSSPSLKSTTLQITLRLLGHV